jgi:hypothetical protein
MSLSPLQSLIVEARQDLGRKPAPQVDWARVDRKLFDRIEQSENASHATGRSLQVAWAAGAALVSAAAVAAMVLGRSAEVSPIESVRASSDEPAGTVVAIDGDGDLLVNGKQAPVGSTLRLDDVVEARGAARATVERPGKVTFALEHGTRAVVEHTHGALVLALESGSVEAQVVPVPRGEAFAVDVGRARVAVHGTHLRVERQHGNAGPSRSGDLVVVDLNEGVVSVGQAPRIGSTSGVLVTAPAHAEFAADDAGTLSITHNVAQVRAPVALVALGQVAQARPAPPPLQPAPAAHPDSGEVRGAPAATPQAKSEHAASGGGSGLPVLADPNADSTLAAAVRACFADRSSAANVTVSVSTTLHLTLHGDGTVRGARFEPPVAPDINACAAQSIYKARFTHGGAADIAVDFREPSTSAP